MNQFIEKLNAVEAQLADLSQHFEPLRSRVDRLRQAAESVSTQVETLLTESTALRDSLAAVRQDFSTVLSAVLTTVDEARVEGEQLQSQAEATQKVQDSITNMFGETFQVVSRFLDTAKKLGIVDADKAQEILVADSAVDGVSESVAAPVAEAPATMEVAVEEPVEPVTEETVEAEPETIVEEPSMEESIETVLVEAEPGAEFETVAEEPAESNTEPEDDPLADFMDDLPEALNADSTPAPATGPVTESTPELTVPALPEVSATALPPAVEEEDAESLAEIVSQLDLAPLQFDTGVAEPESAATDAAADDEQKIEDLLSELSQPIST